MGGGVAGLTLAALLRQRGEEPTVVEKVEEYGRAGYVITLWPMGNRVLRGLGLSEGFRQLGAPLERTVLRDGRGRVLRIIRWGSLMECHGETRKLERADLLDLLRYYHCSFLFAFSSRPSSSVRSACAARLSVWSSTSAFAACCFTSSIPCLQLALLL
ncbi:MAG: NAD(P)-binding protein [Actinobacteria bacterium]|nr:NAD(P)-binding protein [Actinomycetota bacterium]